VEAVRAPAAPQARGHLAASSTRDANVQVVVVVHEWHHGAGRTGELRVRADVHGLSARGDEALDEVLGQRRVDLRSVARRFLALVRARVVDVHVEAVLVTGVADVSELGAKVASMRTAEVADRHPGRARIRPTVLARDPQH
jgi:hypothetical protein